MNQENLEYLKKSLKYLGFGDKLDSALENMIKEKHLQFQLKLTGEFKHPNSKESVDYTIDFKKSDQSDMYFLNRYQATLRNENPELDKTQTFYNYKGYGVTSKEAFNLLSGRAVRKDFLDSEDKPYKAWMKLDFTEKDKHNNFKSNYFYSGYGYDLEAATKKYPIKELGNEEEKAKLLKSLEKGNVQQVTFVKDGREEKMFVEANPQYKNLTVYDSKREKIFQGLDKNETQQTEKSKEQKEESKKDIADENRKDQKTSRRRGVGV